MKPLRHLRTAGTRWSWVFFGIPERFRPLRWVYLDAMRDLLRVLARRARFVGAP